MHSFTGGVVSTEVEKRRWDEDGFLVSLKNIRYFFGNVSLILTIISDLVLTKISDTENR